VATLTTDMDLTVRFYEQAFDAVVTFEVPKRDDHPWMKILDLGGGAALNVFEVPADEILGDRRRQGGRGAIDHFALEVDSRATLELAKGLGRGPAAAARAVAAGAVGGPAGGCRWRAGRGAGGGAGGADLADPRARRRQAGRERRRAPRCQRPPRRVPPTSWAGAVNPTPPRSRRSRRRRPGTPTSTWREPRAGFRSTPIRPRSAPTSPARTEKTSRPTAAPSSTSRSPRGNNSRSSPPEAMTSGGRMSLPRERRSGSHRLAPRLSPAPVTGSTRPRRRAGRGCGPRRPGRSRARRRRAPSPSWPTRPGARG
jgi:hypothetical protein